MPSSTKDPAKVSACSSVNVRKRQKYLGTFRLLLSWFHYTDGLLGKEARFLPKKLPAMLADIKWEKPYYSKVCSYVSVLA
jgi:hypothetical protein